MAKRKRRRLHPGRILFVLLVFAGLLALLFLAGIKVRSLFFAKPVVSETTTDNTSTTYQLDHTAEVEALKNGNALDKVSTAGFTDEEIRSLFFSAPLSDYQINKISGSTFFSQQDFITIEDLRYVRCLYVDFNADTRIGEMIVNEEVSSDIEDILYDLYLHHYPIGKMALADTYQGSEQQNMEANNTFALLFSQSYSMKQDAFNSGYAIHLNPMYNPKVTEEYGRRVVTPASSYPYSNRDNLKKYMITPDDLAYKAFTSKGFKWAGSDEKTQNYGVFWKEYPHKETEQTNSLYGEEKEEEPAGEVIGYDIYGQPIYSGDQQSGNQEENPYGYS